MGKTASEATWNFTPTGSLPNQVSIMYDNMSGEDAEGLTSRLVV
jgi:hypothetical protein